MSHYIYLLIAKSFNRYITYAGYAKNVEKRLILHNISKGAKFTKGRKWTIIYKKRFSSKKKAMKEEYILKNNYKFRKFLKYKYLKKNENSNFTSV